MDQLSLRAKVDLISIDYLLALAISGMLYMIAKKSAGEVVEGHTERHIENHVDLVQSETTPSFRPKNHTNCVAVFRAVIFSHQIESPLPSDLDIKMGIFDVVNFFRAWEPPKDPLPQKFKPLSEIAIMFMNLCQSASQNVSWTRTLDLGARFLVHAILEEGSQFPEPLQKLSTWKAEDPGINGRWEENRDSHLLIMPPPHGTECQFNREKVDEAFTLASLQHDFAGFMEDLMEVLDVPLLIQAEQGQLEGFTREETQQILEHCMRPLRG